jgi:hypothetical protein
MQFYLLLLGGCKAGGSLRNLFDNRGDIDGKKRGPDLFVIFKPYWLFGKEGTSHGSRNASAYCTTFQSCSF